jgi:hypothetical protein
VGIAAPARLQVQARYSLDSVDDERKWIQAGLYIDGTLYIAFAEDVGGTALDWDGEGVGFCAHESDLLQVDNFTISSLHRLVEWTTIDPGSSPASGMARAIGSTRVSYMCRYDDTLRVWRPGNRDLDWTVESGRWTRLDTRTSIDSPNHVRVQAAIHESDGFSNDDIRDRMHRFAIHNDPNIMSEHEAYLESQRVLHDHKERAKVVRFVTPPNYLLEPNDRIYIDGADWRVVSVNTVVTVESNRPRIASVIEAQRYTELIEQGAYPWVLE